MVLTSETLQRTRKVEIDLGRDVHKISDIAVAVKGGADMVAWACAGFTGSVDGSTVRFAINDGSLELPSVEGVGTTDTHYSGTAAGTVGGRTIAATFNWKAWLTPRTAAARSHPVACLGSPDGIRALSTVRRSRRRSQGRASTTLSPDSSCGAAPGSAGRRGWGRRTRSS
jgi:hypothetical protein